jgi:hypothetical protein
LRRPRSTLGDVLKDDLPHDLVPQGDAIDRFGEVTIAGQFSRRLAEKPVLLEAKSRDQL